MNQLTDFFLKLFDYSDWPPRWHSGEWSKFHGWLYIISDLLIWSAYFTISLIILRFINHKKDARFLKLYYFFGAFILACGATHFLDAVTFWYPVYRLTALMRLITAGISWLTVFYIFKKLPVFFAMRLPQTLENEIEQRKNVEEELRLSEEQLQTIYKNAPDAVLVISSKGFVVKWNPAAEVMFGWKEEEIKGKVLNEIVVPKELQHVYKTEMKRFLKTGESQFLNKTTIQKVICKNGEILKVEFTVSPVAAKNDYLFIAFVRDVTETRKAESALKESEERYRLLTGEVKDYAIIMLSPEGIINSWNEGAQRIKGYSANEIIGKHFSIFFTSDAIKKNLPLEILAVTRRDGRYEDESWSVKKDGTLFWAHTTLTALKRKDDIIGFSKITRDITERKRSEEHIRQLNTQLEQRVIERTNELQQSETKYRQLFANSPMPMWVLDMATYNFIDVNEAAIKHYGYSRQQFLSMNALDIRPEEEKKRFVQLDRSTSNALRNTGIWKHLKQDSSVIYAEVSSHEMIINGKNARLVLSIDVTERKKAEERLDFALDAGQIGIWELDLITNISVRNLRHDQIFGYENVLPDWSMQKFLDHVHPDDVANVETSFYKALVTGIWVVEIRIYWPDSSLRWALINGKVIGEINVKPIKMLGTILDITQSKKAEEEILQLNNDLEQKVQTRTRELYSANKEMESFSYSVSHDLRAPLRAIYSYSQILVEEYKTGLDEEGNRLLSRVMFNAKKMGLLIDQLLEFSRMGKMPLDKSNISMNKLVTDVINELDQSNKYHQNIKVGNLGYAFADEVTIHLVFQNLLMNAIKYSSKKENPLMEVGIIKTDKGQAWFVRDNGAGFDMTYYEKMFGVFQRFHRQEEFEGTGVGLAIVQKIILKHGGQVWAESVVNQGATFYFTLQ